MKYCRRENFDLFIEDDERQLIQHLVNEYLLEGSNDVLDLIRNCPNEYFEVKFNQLKKIFFI